MTVPPLPAGPFAVIACDPPWAWRNFSKVDGLPQRAAVQHYDTMPLEAMKALPVEACAAKDCVLHMWTLSSHAHHAMELAEAWGFNFKSLGFIWVKTQKGDPGRAKMGMGKWLRQEGEVSFIFTRGKPGRLDKGVRQVIMEPAREHSRKPDIAYARMERLSAGPRLEMFSRVGRVGWTVWGQQAHKFDINKGSENVQSATPSAVGPAAAS